MLQARERLQDRAESKIEDGKKMVMRWLACCFWWWLESGELGRRFPFSSTFTFASTSSSYAEFYFSSPFWGGVLIWWCVSMYEYNLGMVWRIRWQYRNLDQCDGIVRCRDMLIHTLVLLRWDSTRSMAVRLKLSSVPCLEIRGKGWCF